MNNNSGGLGFMGTVTVVLVILKLANLITWSWWWVLAPFWIPTALWIIMAIVMFSGGGLARFFWNMWWKMKG